MVSNGTNSTPDRTIHQTITPSGLPHPETRAAQIDPDLDFPLARLVVAHRIEALEQVRQQAQTVFLDVAVGLNARLVLVEAQVRIEPGLWGGALFGTVETSGMK